MQTHDDSQVWEVGAELASVSLAAALRSRCSISWGRARDWIAAGKIRIDGQLCTDPRRPVRAGERIELRLNARRPRPLLDRIAAGLIHVDDHVAVIDKPPGVSTVPYEEGERDTLEVLLRRALAARDSARSARGRRRAAPGRGGPPALGIVHRLDRDTSGLMVFARSWLAKQRLAEQFRAHTVIRHYLALAHGRVAPTTIRSELVRDRGDGLRGSQPRGGSEQRPVPGARLAVTHVELVEELHGASLIRCRLETGRTHQIRIHLSELGHPILGERAYIRDYRGELLPAPRLMLHAAELGFRHPATGELLRWELPPPEDMRRVLETLR